MDVTVKVEGLAEAVRKLELLPERVGRRALRRALRRGANVIRNGARENFKRLDDPGTGENIARNVVVQGMSAKRERSVGGVGMRVGVLGGSKSKTGSAATGGKGNPGGDTWYWRLLEFGTSTIAARAPMRKAMASQAMGAYDAFANAAEGEIDKELGKL